MSFVLLLCLVVGIMLLSTLIRSAIGFGGALLAMPLLALIIPINAAAPLVALSGATISLVILATSWRTVDLRSAWRLIAVSAFGIPCGLLLLAYAPEQLVRGVLGVLLILYGSYSLVRPELPAVKRDVLAVPFGFVAGVLGGAYNTNGPPIVIYGMLRRWTPEQFRATLQCYFLVTGMLTLVGHGMAGLWTPFVLRLYLYSIPAVLIGIVLGDKIGRFLPQEAFRRAVCALLVASGILCLT